MTKRQQTEQRLNPAWAGPSTLGGKQCTCSDASWDHKDDGKGACKVPGCKCLKFEEERENLCKA